MREIVYRERDLWMREKVRLCMEEKESWRIVGERERKRRERLYQEEKKGRECDKGGTKRERERERKGERKYWERGLCGRDCNDKEKDKVCVNERERETFNKLHRTREIQKRDRK